MNKNRYIIFLVTLSLLLSPVAYAECTTEELEYFKEIEDDYIITYDFNRSSGDYNLELYNPDPSSYDFYIYGKKENLSVCENVSEEETVCNNLKGDSYRIEIVGITETCNAVLKEEKFDLTVRNKYWNDPLCEGIEEFVLCQPTYDREMDHDTFVSRINTYKKTKEKEQPAEEQPTEKNEFINKTFKYIENNLFQIIVITVFVIAIVVTAILTLNSIKKSRRLE